MAWKDLNREQRLLELKRVFNRCFSDAESIANNIKPNDLNTRLGKFHTLVEELGSMEHAAPGIALTLAA